MSVLLPSGTPAIEAIAAPATRAERRSSPLPSWRTRAISVGLDVAAVAGIGAAGVTGRFSPWAYACFFSVIAGALVHRGGLATVARALALTAALAPILWMSGSTAPADSLAQLLTLLAITVAFGVMAEVAVRRQRRLERDQLRAWGLLGLVEEIGAESDMESLLGTVTTAAARLLSTDTVAPVTARVVRIERDKMVVAAEHGPAEPALGRRHALTTDPLVLAAVTEDRTVTNGELYYRDVSPLAGAAGFGTRAASPIHVNGDVYGAVVVEFPGQNLSRGEVAYLDGIARITSLAVSNLIGGDAGIVAAGDADALTGLAGRRSFSERIESIRGTFALLSIDVDRLKSINHTLGREAGDDALRAVARALTSSMREHDLIARVGGDEFAILIEGVGTAVVAAAAERVRASVANLVFGPLQVRVSVGWALGTIGEEAQAVWSRADDALLRAKHEGRNRAVGSLAARTGGTPSKGWTTLLSRVLASQQINPVYQPIVSLSDLHVVAYEGLARPVGLDASDSVDEFFATAHELGVVNELDWICRRAVVRGAEGLRADTVLYCNIDLSAVDDPAQDVDQMLSLLSWAGRDPGDIVLEVTDADRFSSLVELEARIDAYRRFGFRIAIDDAGRAGMGVELLHAVRPDVIKIDQAISNKCFDRAARGFILEAVALADQTRAEVVAEGIEEQAVAEELTRLGVDYGQGFLFGRPAQLPSQSPERGRQPVQLRAVAQQA